MSTLTTWDKVMRTWVALAFGGLVVFVATQGNLPQDIGIFALVPMLLLLLLLPVLICMRLSHAGQQFRQGYQEGRTADMTDAEIDAFENRVPFVEQYWWVFTLIALVLAIVLVPYLSPAIVALWLYRLLTPKKTGRMLRHGRSPVRPGSILDLGDSARERDRGRPDPE